MTDALPAQHSLQRSLALSLAPGALSVALSLPLIPAVVGAGYPPLMATLLACVVGVSVLPWMLMRREARRLTGRSAVFAVIAYRERLPGWQFVLLVAALLGWAMAVFTLLGPASNALRDRLFDWMPRAFTMPVEPSCCQRSALLVTGAAALILSPLVINPMEELYFRGFLLPRLGRFGFWAPVINTVFWATTHLWQPWGIPTFIIAMLPAVVVVHWKRNVWLSVVGHALGNFLMILAIAFREVP